MPHRPFRCQPFPPATALDRLFPMPTWVAEVAWPTHFFASRSELYKSYATQELPVDCR